MIQFDSIFYSVRVWFESPKYGSIGTMPCPAAHAVYLLYWVIICASPMHGPSFREFLCAGVVNGDGQVAPIYAKALGHNSIKVTPVRKILSMYLWKVWKPQKRITLPA